MKHQCQNCGHAIILRRPKGMPTITCDDGTREGWDRSREWGQTCRNWIPKAMTPKQSALYPHMVLMIDALCACIETRVYPVHGSPCHRMARRLVADSGMAPKRMRRRLPAVKGAAAAMPWEGGR